MDDHTTKCDTETEKSRLIQEHCLTKPQRRTTRNLPSGVANSVTERNFLWLGEYHKRHIDTRNQSFPICKRNQTPNTKGYRIVPSFGQLN